MKDIYYTVFLLFYRLFGSAWPASINLWKGVGGVTIVQVFALIAASSCLELWADLRTVNAASVWTIRLAIVTLFFTNYLLLVVCGDAIRFEREFADLPRSRKANLVATCSMLLVVIVVCFVVSGLAHRRMVGAG